MAVTPQRPPPAGAPRSLDRQGRTRFKRKGLKRVGLGDVYHRIVALRWRWLFALVLGCYVLVNLAFATLYFEMGHAIDNARPGSFADCFFFSVQTMATIGYGKMTPATDAANVLVSFEALLGMLGVALATGLIFAKFARPSARVMFSSVMATHPRDGKPCLVFRLANERATQIVEAQLTVALLLDGVTAEGERIRRISTLELQRGRSAVFALSWLAVHVLDEKSPLFGMDAAALARQNAEIVVSFSGLEEITGQTVHARHAYHHSEIHWQHRFVDVITMNADGSREIDYTRFDDVVPL